MSQQELADEVGISRTYLSQIEQGQATNLSLRLARQLSGILGIDPPQRNIPNAPEALIQLAEEENIPPEHVEMLAGLAYRGRRPETREQWRLLYNLIKTTLESFDRK